MPPEGSPFWEGNANLEKRVADELKVRKDAAPAGFSDDALALRFTAKHGADLRYVAGWGKWLQFDGRRWKFDATLAVFDQARVVCRDAARDADEKDTDDIKSARTVAAVEKLAKSDRRHAGTVDMWDLNPWLLNTPGGSVDLKTGQLQPHCREDHHTKITAVTPGVSVPLGWLSSTA